MVVQRPRGVGEGEKDEGGDNESDGGGQGADAAWQRCPVPGGGAKMFGRVEITPAKSLTNSAPLCLKLLLSHAVYCCGDHGMNGWHPWGILGEP